MSGNSGQIGLEIRGGYDWSYDQLSLAFFDHKPSSVWIAEPLKFKEHKNGSLVEPTVRLHRNEAQQIFDLLWKEGYRPKDGTGNAGHTAALNNHLQDMRKLVFDKWTA